MVFETTPLYALPVAAIYLVLWFRVSSVRSEAKVSFGDGGNPVLRWNASNVAIQRDAAENIKPVKDKSTGRIDGIEYRIRIAIPIRPVRPIALQ